MQPYSKIGSAETLSNRVKDQIEQSILQKIYKPGDKLPTEKEMCSQFGVSRTAVREAVQMLRSQAIINVRKGSGIFVSQSNSEQITKSLSYYLKLHLDNDLILKVVEVRRRFEPQIAALAARNRDDKNLWQLQKNIQDIENSNDLDAKGWGEIDRDFHRGICESAKNPIVLLQMEPIYRLMPELRTLVYNRIDSALSETLNFYLMIFKAIRKQDEESAQIAMVDHLELAEQHARQLLT